MEPQNNNQTNPPTATAPAPQAAPSPAPAPAATQAPAAPAAPAAAPAKSGSKMPMWLLVVFALVVVGGVAYFLMA